jgi:hypothetical protein
MSAIRDDNTKEEVETITKISVLDLFSNDKKIFGATGDITTGAGDKYTFGKVNVSVDNYENILADYKKGAIDFIKAGDDGRGNKIDKETQQAYLKIADSIFKVALDLIKKNSDTKVGGVGVVVVTRDKNSNKYFVNGEDLNSVIQSLALIR